jgi:ATP-dependent DNA helicase RecG
MLNWNDSIQVLPRIGKATLGHLKRLGINTIGDLLYYFPYRYEDYSEVVSIENLQAGQSCTVRGRVDLLNSRRSRYRQMNLTEALISDETGSVRVVWFNQPYIAKTLQVGDWVYLSGEVKESDPLQFVNPNYEKAQRSASGTILRQTSRILSIYSITKGLSSKQLRFFVNTALQYLDKYPDFLPPEIVQKYHFMDLPSALKEIHFPSNQSEVNKAIERFKFEELFLLQLHGNRIRQQLAQYATPEIKFDEELTKDFTQSLPYQLTDEQRKSAWEIINDMKSPQKPMNRLLEGDVGSGKTVVAAMAILNVLKNNYSAILLSPTEILAEQHWKTISKLFAKYSDFKTVLYTRTQRFVSQKDLQQELSKKEILEVLNDHSPKLVIGTHSLLQEKAEFNNIALIIVDEQHRFGVKQRDEIKDKAGLATDVYPHFLAMTATPIPRSLALTIYGDLDLSIIEKLPPGRQPISSQLLDPNDKVVAYDLLRQEIQAGRQAFVVCPLIDESDKLGVKSVGAAAAELKEIFPAYEIAILHGKLKGQEKMEIMAKMLKNEINILVSTAVIEVGIDIQNATVMMIEGAERFGLAQLHQFRGRVGRGQYQSYCLLLPSEKISPRLEMFVKSNNGFELAEYDLQLRGPGEVFGTNQSGMLSLKLAKITDTLLIYKAREASQFILEKDLKLIRYPQLAERLANFEQLNALQ